MCFNAIGPVERPKGKNNIFEENYDAGLCEQWVLIDVEKFFHSFRDRTLFR